MDGKIFFFNHIDRVVHAGLLLGPLLITEKRNIKPKETAAFGGLSPIWVSLEINDKSEFDFSSWIRPSIPGMLSHSLHGLFPSFGDEESRIFLQFGPEGNIELSDEPFIKVPAALPRVLGSITFENRSKQVANVGLRDEDNALAYFRDNVATDEAYTFEDIPAAWYTVEVNLSSPYSEIKTNPASNRGSLLMLRQPDIFASKNGTLVVLENNSNSLLELKEITDPFALNRNSTLLFVERKLPDFNAPKPKAKEPELPAVQRIAPAPAPRATFVFSAPPLQGLQQGGSSPQKAPTSPRQQIQRTYTTPSQPAVVSPRGNQRAPTQLSADNPNQVDERSPQRAPRKIPAGGSENPEPKPPVPSFTPSNKPPVPPFDGGQKPPLPAFSPTTSSSPDQKPPIPPFSEAQKPALPPFSVSEQQAISPRSVSKPRSTRVLQRSATETPKATVPEGWKESS